MSEFTPKPVLEVKDETGEVIASAYPIIGSIVVAVGEGGLPFADFEQALRKSLGDFASEDTPIIYE